jgi:hypothetical protein
VGSYERGSVPSRYITDRGYIDKVSDCEFSQEVLYTMELVTCSFFFFN